MSTQSLALNGKKRVLCSCRKCDQNVKPGPSVCELVSPPTKRRRFEEAAPSDEDLLDRLFAFNESEGEVLALDEPADDVCYKSDGDVLGLDRPADDVCYESDGEVLALELPADNVCYESDGEALALDRPADDLGYDSDGGALAFDRTADDPCCDSEDSGEGKTDSNDEGSEPEEVKSGDRRASVVNRGSNYGSNMYNGNEKGKRKGLRPVVIDGSNVAMGHTNGRYFSCKGLKICVDYFLERKHRIYVIVPHFRQCHGQARDQYILKDLYQKGHLYFTPSRMVDGRLEVPYDDRYIVQLAAATGGVIVSSDRYRDLLKENPRWAETIKNRLLMFTWVDDILFFPQDPFGKRGPSLDELLRF